MRYAVFGVTTILTAMLVVFAWIAVFSRHPWAALPKTSTRLLKSIPADTRALAEHSFVGFLQSGKLEHWVRVSCATGERSVRTADETLTSPQPVRLEVTLADGSGSPTFAGWVDPRTGYLHLYIEQASSQFSKFRRVEGRVAGPALVNGVPTLYLEASPISISEAADDETNRWVGHLVVQESL
ncbi:MAG: hypothetical protein HRF45_06815 [Fimbriimonadia bacterium]